jgi:hypothetical protein
MSIARRSFFLSLSLWGVLAGALFLHAAPAAAQGALGPGGVASGQVDTEPFPLHASVSLTNSAGAGTFVAGPTNNPNIITGLTLQPTVVYKGWVGIVQQYMQLEWTQSEFTTYQNQIELFDTAMALRYQGLRLPDLGLIFSVGGGYQLPLSMLSRQAGSLGTMTAAARATYFNPNSGLLLYGGVNGGYALLVPELSQRFANNPVKQIDDANTLSCIVRNATDLVNYACGMAPIQARWGVGTGGSWTTLDGALVLSLDLGYSQWYSAFRVMERDEFTADNAVTGLVPRQFLTSNIGATWVAQDWLFLTLGAQTWGPALSADGKRPRFPLWDFESTRENLSQVYFDVTVQY